MPVTLPIRGQRLLLRPGDTHHAPGNARSRCIDVILGSAPALGVARVHNGLSCRGDGGCQWEECVEYTRGDHFLLDVSIPFRATSSGLGAGALRMPRWWQDPESWRAGLQHAQPPLRALSGLVRHCCEGEEQSAVVRALSSTATQWLADAVAWLLHLVLGLVLAGWVVPRSVQSRSAPREVTRPLRGRVRSALEGPGSVSERAAKCLRLLRPRETRPASCLRGPDGQTLSPDESRRAWVEQLRAQSEWPGPWDLSFHHQVTAALSSVRGRARTARGQGVHDVPVAASEVASSLGSMGHTAATTPDLVPRVALQLGDSALDEAVWLLQRLTGPGCLAVRPAGWRGSCAVPLHKAGPADAGESFRLIMVKAQLGLLQEAIVHRRLREPVRTSVLPG